MKNLAVTFVSKGAALASSISGDITVNRDWSFKEAEKMNNVDGTDTSGIEENTISIDLSIDWSPSESVQTSRKNTLFSSTRESKNFCLQRKVLLFSSFPNVM